MGRDYVGGGHVAAILGISPWQSPWSVWAELVGLLPEQQIPEERQRIFHAGLDAEPYLAAQCARRTGLHVACTQIELAHPTVSYRRGHADGAIFDGPPDGPVTLDGALAGWEGKTSRDYRPWEQLPAYYEAQVRWYLHLAPQVDRWLVTVGFAGWTSHDYEIVRDPVEETFIVDRVTRFWDEHVATGVPPAVDGSDATLDAIAAVWPRHQEGVAVDLDDVADHLTGLDDAKARRRAAEHDEKAHKAAVAAVLADAEIGLIAGLPAVTYRTQTRTTTCAACGHTETSEPFRVLRPAPKPKKEKRAA